MNKILNRFLSLLRRKNYIYYYGLAISGVFVILIILLLIFARIEKNKNKNTIIINKPTTSVDLTTTKEVLDNAKQTKAVPGKVISINKTKIVIVGVDSKQLEFTINSETKYKTGPNYITSTYDGIKNGAIVQITYNPATNLAKVIWYGL